MRQKDITKKGVDTDDGGEGYGHGPMRERIWTMRVRDETNKEAMDNETIGYS